MESLRLSLMFIHLECCYGNSSAKGFLTLRELFSGGMRPYDGLNNPDTAEKIMAGILLPKLANCPVSDLMESCWKRDPSKRPTFEMVLENLRSL